MATNTLSNLTFRDIGQGVKAAHDEDNGLIWLQVPASKEAVKSAKPSSSGKTRVLASTGGFQGIGPARINLNATVPLD